MFSRSRIHTAILCIWTFALLTASVGISVRQIYCYCVGQTTWAWLGEAEDACAVIPTQSNEQPGCCVVEDETACCTESEASSEEDGCTRKSVKVYILKAEYLVGQPLDKMFDYPVWADEFPEYLRLYRPVFCDNCKPVDYPPQSPPPLSGRAICLRHQLFLC